MKKKQLFIAAFTAIFAALLIAGCPQKPKNKKNTEIKISAVRIGKFICAENGVTEIEANEADLTVEFAENYSGLTVKVNGKPASLNGKTATVKILNINETGRKIKIEAAAQGRENRTFEFTLKKPLSKKIIITSVKLDGKSCTKNAASYTERETAPLTVEFEEVYKNLKVKINNTEAEVIGKTVSAEIKGITGAGITVKIEAAAKNKETEVFTFTAIKNGGGTLPKAEISQLIFEAENINPGAGTGLTDRKIYTNYEKPFLKDIAADGSTNVGTSSSPSLNVFIRYINNNAEERMLSVENKTNSKTGQSSEPEYDESLKVPIKLNTGDNNLVITYTEKNKEPLVYKVIVTYTEPEYKPVLRIQVAVNAETHDWKTFSTDEDFSKLEAGTETVNLTGKTETVLRVEMQDRWYDEDDWKLSLDGADIPKTDFKKNPLGLYSTYIVEKTLSVQSGEVKKFILKFENAKRGYLKNYSFSVKQTEALKIDKAIVIDFNEKNQISQNYFSEYEFDAAKNSYKIKTPFEIDSAVQKIYFFVTAEDSAITAKYAYSETEKDYTAIAASGWRDIARQSFEYKWMGFPQTKDGYLAEQEIKQGTQYLYMLLEKNGVKTCYITPIACP